MNNKTNINNMLFELTKLNSNMRKVDFRSINKQPLVNDKLNLRRC